MKLQTSTRPRLFIILSSAAVGLCISIAPAVAAPGAPGAPAAPKENHASPSPQMPTVGPSRGNGEASVEPPVDGTRESNSDEASASRNTARTRMRECGHQWSGMKKNGSAAGMTWKEFSQGCLARR